MNDGRRLVHQAIRESFADDLKRLRWNQPFPQPKDDDRLDALPSPRGEGGLNPAESARP